MSALWKTVRVFISSTFRDMHAERDHLVKVVFPRLREWCELRHLHLVDIDLRWGVTREEAENGKAIEICLKEIDESRPFFLCLLGERYGWVPSPLPSEEQYRFTSLARQGLSLTHLEILHAAFTPVPRIDGAHSNRCPHAFFYFRDSSCIPAEGLSGYSAEEIREHRSVFFESRPELAQRLAALKEQIMAQYPDQVFWYSGQWDGEAENVEDATMRGRLTHLDLFGQRVEQDLVRAIEAQFADHLSSLHQAVDPIEEERAYHEAFVENRTRIHVPRMVVERELDDYASGTETSPLVVTGQSGSGKSAILAHWSKARIMRRDGELLITRFIGASPSSTNLATLLAGICAELEVRLSLIEETEQVEGNPTIKPIGRMTVPEDPIEVLRKWPRFLEAASKRGHVVILLDALNQLDKTADPLRAQWLPDTLPPNIRLIVSVLDQSRLPPRTNSSGWADVLRKRGFRTVNVPDLDSAVREQMIRDIPSVFCKTLDADQIKLLLQNPATKNPLFLTVALEELRVFGDFAGVERRIKALPETRVPSLDILAEPDIEEAINELFGQVLGRLERDVGHELQITDRQSNSQSGLVQVLFGFLACARDGLSEGELSDLIASRFPRHSEAARNGALQVALRQIRNYLMRKAHPQETLIDFYHQSFWKAAWLRYAAPNQWALRYEMATYFRGKGYWLDSLPTQQQKLTTCPPQTRKARLRTVTELPWQTIRLVEASRTAGSDHKAMSYAAVEELFTNLNFLEAKVEARKVFELATDFSDAIHELPQERPVRRIMELLEEGIRRDIQFISRHETTLFQCLWNSERWYDSDDRTKHYAVSNDASRGTILGQKVSELLQKWRTEKETSIPGFLWVRSLRPLPSPLGISQRVVLAGHGTSAWCAAFSPDGSLLASGMHDGTVRVWNPMTGEEINRINAGFTGHSPSVTRIAFSPDGRLLAGVSGMAGPGIDRAIRVWEVVTSRELLCLRGHTDVVTTLEFSPTGVTLASGSWDKTVRIWKLSEGRELAQMSPSDGAVKRVAFSHDAKRLAVLGNCCLTLFDVERGEKTWSRKSDTPAWTYVAPFLDVAYSRNDEQVVTIESGVPILTRDTHQPNAIVVRNVQNGEIKYLWPIDEFPPNTDCAAVISSDGLLAACLARDKRTVSLYSIMSGSRRNTLPKHDAQLHSMAFSPDGKTIAVATWQDIDILSVDGDFVLPQIEEGHTEAVMALSASPGGKLVGSASPCHIATWDMASGLCVRKTYSELFTGRDLAFSPDSTQLATTASYGVWIEDTSSGQGRLRIAETSNSSSIAISGDRRLVAAGRPFGEIVVWRTEDGKVLHRLTGHSERVTALSMSKNRRLLASASRDKNVRVWDLEDGHQVLAIPGDNAALAYDGKYLVASRSADGVVATTLLNLRTGQRQFEWIDKGFTQDRLLIISPAQGHIASVSGGDVRIRNIAHVEHLTILHHGQQIEAVAFSRTGSLFVTASMSLVKVWDVSRGKELESREWLPNSYIRAIAFSDDEEKIVSAGTSGIDVWQWRCRRDPSRIDSRYDPMWIRFDNKRLYTYDQGNTFRTWDVATGGEVSKMVDPDADVRFLAITKDGKHIIGGMTDSTVRVWDAASGQEQCRSQRVAFKDNWNIGLRGIAVSPGGEKILASVGETVQLWDSRSGRNVFVFRGYTGFSPSDVMCSDDGEVIQVQSISDATVHFWRIDPAQYVGSFWRPRGIRAVVGNILCRDRHGGAETEIWDSEVGGPRGWIPIACERVSRPAKSRLFAATEDGGSHVYIFSLEGTW